MFFWITQWNLCELAIVPPRDDDFVLLLVIVACAVVSFVSFLFWVFWFADFSGFDPANGFPPSSPSPDPEGIAAVIGEANAKI